MNKKNKTNRVRGEEFVAYIVIRERFAFHFKFLIKLLNFHNKLEKVNLF